MAINVSQAFHRTSANPIDETLALTKAQMVAINDNLMPSKYLTVCQDDGKIYLYDKTVESTVETGRFRVFEGGTTITVDPTPTSGSTNAVSSGGTYTALDGKIDKVSGKQLSTEDYTTAEKTKLSGVETGAEVNIIEGITVNGDAITPDANRIAALTVLTNTVNNLLNYYNKTETYTKSEVDALVSAVAGATFESVPTLPTTDIKTNVIYLVPKQTPQTSDIKDEYINLDGTTAGWELIGDTQADLSNYVTTTALNTALGNYTTTADLTTLLAGKVDKVTGKQLSTEDYTTAEKTKLAGLSNYDDTALSGRVSAIEGVVPSTATTSNKLATMSDVASGGAHTIEDSTGVDMTARTNLQFVGAAVSDDSTNNRTVVTVDVSGKADKVTSATSGNFAALDANGNLTDSGKKASDFGSASDVAGKEAKFRYTTMPTASSENVNDIVQYVGTTTANYTNGYFYKCVLDDGAYKWVESATMDISGSTKDARLKDEVTEIGVDYNSSGTGFRIIPYINVNVLDVLTDGGRTLTVSDLEYVASLYHEGRVTQSEFEDVFGETPIPFETTSLDDILKVVEMYYDGDLSLSDIQTKWSIGDSRAITTSAISAYDSVSQPQNNTEVVIVDFNHFTLTESYKSNTHPLLVLGLKNPMPNGMRRVGDQKYGYPNWGIRTWVTSDSYFAGSLPSDYKNNIKAVSRQVVVNGESADQLETINDAIFIPTEKEWATTGYLSNLVDGSTLSYYEDITHRQKEVQLMTATKDGFYSSIILTNGNVARSSGVGDSNEYLGIIPHFCI